MELIPIFFCVGWIALTLILRVAVNWKAVCIVITGWAIASFFAIYWALAYFAMAADQAHMSDGDLRELVGPKKADEIIDTRDTKIYAALGTAGLVYLSIVPGLFYFSYRAKRNGT